MVSAVHTRCDIAVSALFLAVGLMGCFGVAKLPSEGPASPETPRDLEVAPGRSWVARKKTGVRRGAGGACSLILRRPPATRACPMHP